MSKVFEALERERKSKIEENGGAPLAAKTGISESESTEQSEVRSPFSNQIEDEGGGYELPSAIGAPVGPRPNDGVLFPSSNLRSQEDAISGGIEQFPPTAPPANGKLVIQTEQPVANAGNRGTIAKKERTQPPSERTLEKESARTWTQHEIPVEPIALPRLHPRLILLTDPGASGCEQFRTLRTQLFHAAEKTRAQIVVVTSALAGEGKTSTVLNLALAIAQSKEKRILVIDGDLRRPAVASYLGLQPKAGLKDVLAGEMGPLDPVVCLDSHELYVLPVCRESSNPTELLSSERLETMLEEMRKYFDFILIDSPPVMPFADARLLANHSDTVLFVIRAGMAPYETVEKAIEALPAGRILGTVLNSAEHLNGAYYYDYYYSYAHREERRGSFWEKIKGRFGAGSVGK